MEEIIKERSVGPEPGMSLPASPPPRKDEGRIQMRHGYMVATKHEYNAEREMDFHAGREKTKNWEINIDGGYETSNREERLRQRRKTGDAEREPVGGADASLIVFDTDHRSAAKYGTSGADLPQKDLHTG